VTREADAGEENVEQPHFHPETKSRGIGRARNMVSYLPSGVNKLEGDASEDTFPGRVSCHGHGSVTLRLRISDAMATARSIQVQVRP
jgi:hypothetical protein